MKPVLITFLIMFALLNFTGCATTTYHDRFKTVSSERHEFEDLEENYKLYRGVLSADKIVRDNRKYYRVQFRDILAGEGRLLDILISEEYGVNPVIYETAEEIKNGRPAYIVLVRMCCDEGHNEIFDPVTSREIEKSADTMNKVLQKKFPESADTDSPVIFCRLSFYNIYHYSLEYNIWKPRNAAPPFSECGFYLDAQYSTLDVKWRRRSRVKTAAVKAGYILPVAVDIITSPVQLICIAAYFAAGGAVR